MYEVWKPVIGWEGLYEVSSLGRVKSLGRTIQLPNRLSPYPPKIMKLETLKKLPYKRVQLVKDGQRKKKLVHVLVGEAFLGPRPQGYEMCHINGDCSDNRVSNLRWDTRANNTLDKIRHGTHNWLVSKGGVIPDNYFGGEN